MGKIWTLITKRSKKRKKNRRLRKRLRDRDKVEVKSMKHSNIPLYSDAFCLQETSVMQADSFWENYKVAQEWQTRHNITWWRSRCIALEHENEILRNKIRLLARNKHYSNVVITDTNNHCEERNTDKNNENGAQNDSDDDDDMEFNMTEDMLDFFETAERHRRDLQEKRKSKVVTTASKQEITKDMPVIDGATSIQARKEAATLLYGDVHPKIMAMEAALTATVDRHKDKTQPQYWPNIPLKP